MQNYYTILGIPSFASNEEIKTAFKKLAKEFHPDRHQGSKFHEEQFKRINEAYQVLSDPEKRKRYDLRIYYSTVQPQNNSYSGAATSTVENKTQTKRPRPKNAPKPENVYTKPSFTQTELKVYAITFAGLIALIISGTIFYNYMNRHVAVKALSEGLQLESKGLLFKAMEKYTEALAYDEEYGEAYKQRGAAFFVYGNFSAAIYDFLKAEECSDSLELRYRILKARSYAKLKKYSEAIKELNLCQSKSPGFDSLYFYRAQIYYTLHNSPLSIKDYLKFLKWNPYSTDARFGLSLAYIKNVEYTKSLVELNGLIQDLPDEGIYYYYRAFALMGIKDTTSACRDFKISRDKGFEKAEKTRRFCK